MQKELIIILLILGLPTFFIMSYGPGQTGAITTEPAKLRVERINLAITFPQPNGIYKTTAFRIRDYLRKGANGNFYYHDQLEDADNFFLLEINLLPELFTLMCMESTERALVSHQPVLIIPDKTWFNVNIESIGQLPCDPQLKQAAAETLAKVMDIDFRLVEMTVKNGKCPELAEESMQRAKDNLAIGEYQAVITNLRNAWSKATCE